MKLQNRDFSLKHCTNKHIKQLKTHSRSGIQLVRNEYAFATKNIIIITIWIIVKKLNSLKHLVRTTVAESHNYNSKYEKGAIT